MQCRDFRDIADSYLGDELLVETNHEVFRHLESCAACRRELEARRAVRARLRSAFVQSQELRPREEFVTRLNAQLRSTALGESKSTVRNRRMWLAIAACLVVAVALGLFGSRLRETARTASTQIAGSENSSDTGANPVHPAHPETGARTLLANLSHDAAGDHRDCAVDYRLAETPISLEEAGQKFDHSYIGLTEAVMSQQATLTGDVEFVEAHSCVFNGRRFGHVVLKHHGRLVSVLVSDLENPETPTTAQLAASTDKKQQVIACAQLDGYQVSCFETARHAVFVVSELSEADNLTLARAVAPSVAEHITRVEVRV